jgi:hypothetical protein
MGMCIVIHRLREKIYSSLCQVMLIKLTEVLNWNPETEAGSLFPERSPDVLTEPSPPNSLAKATRASVYVLRSLYPEDAL